jgi:putative membrane protein
MIVIQSAKFGMFCRYIGRPLALLLAVDAVIAAGYVFGGWKWLAVPDVPLAIFGGVIGMITGFRNASAYARWWEARTVWGGIVNNCRSFAREALTMIGDPTADAEAQWQIHETTRRLVLLQIAYVHALRNQLRGIDPWPELPRVAPELDLRRLRTKNNAALAIQTNMASIVSECYRLGWIDSLRWAALDRTLSTLMDCQGAAERIKNTPMPRLYDLFIRLFITMFCILLPLGMVASLRLWTPAGSTLVGFVFLALDKIGRDLENPFENMPYDIPLTAICQNIEIDLKQMIGDTDIPEPVAAVDGILW